MFYSFIESFSRRYLRGSEVCSSDGDICRVCNKEVGRILKQNESYDRIALVEGNHSSEILWTTVSLFINNRIRNIFEKEEIAGYTIGGFEIIEDKRPAKDKKMLPFEKIDKFNRVIISAPFVKVDWEKSNLEILQPGCDYCNRPPIFKMKPRLIDSIVLDASSWNGNDVFLVEGVPDYYCTEKFKKTIEKYKIKYFKFDEAKTNDNLS